MYSTISGECKCNCIFFFLFCIALWIGCIKKFKMHGIWLNKILVTRKCQTYQRQKKKKYHSLHIHVCVFFPPETHYSCILINIHFIWKFYKKKEENILFFFIFKWNNNKNSSSNNKFHVVAKKEKKRRPTSGRWWTFVWATNKSTNTHIHKAIFSL